MKGIYSGTTQQYESPASEIGMKRPGAPQQGSYRCANTKTGKMFQPNATKHYSRNAHSHPCRSIKVTFHWSRKPTLSHGIRDAGETNPCPPPPRIATKNSARFAFHLGTAEVPSRLKSLPSQPGVTLKGQWLPNSNFKTPNMMNSQRCKLS